ncbi:MAG: T9SS type A sorting domain-containing protein [Bacteroidetes bacterium]|nr:T9SS type A sorting domain-containing protein [Bacteroidota bacterium]
MKLRFISVLILIVVITIPNAFGQWNQEFQINNFDSSRVAGWLPLKKLGDKWEYRFYILDTNKFEIYNNHYGGGVQYTYNFTAEEKAAGNLLYSVGTDLTGDNIVEFYVLAYHGTTDIRQSVKIFDIISKVIVFSLNEPNYSFTAPVIYDIDNDGILEAVFARYIYPYTGAYGYVVYNTGVSTSIGGSIENLKFDLKQNYPNPFNPQTNIEFTLDSSAAAKLEIFDSNGEKIDKLLDSNLPAGKHNIIWRGENSSGNKLASGVYFYRLTVNGVDQNKKMILLK